MASLNREPNGCYVIQFVAANRKRLSIRLGKVPKKVGESIKVKVEFLAAAAAARVPLDHETSAWVANISDDLAAKLAAVGLIAERPKRLTLAGLLDLYAGEKEAGNKSGTRTNHRTISNDLTRFFKPGTDPSSLTEADAGRFADHLRERDLAPYTVARRVRRARSIFAFAVKKKVLPANPFADLKTPAALPDERKAYVPPEDVERLIAVASPEWRTILALCRYAGLRCPSEVYRLTWADVNFATNRMTVPNVKTAGQTGRVYRVCPIFGDLLPHLEDAHELAAPGTVYVVSGDQADRVRVKMDGPNGSNDANTRTALMRLIKRAGLHPWPRLFNTLRASCETDLLEELEFPPSAVTEWMGHSMAIALKHYTRVPDRLFERAARRRAESGAGPVQNPVQHTAAPDGIETTAATEPRPVGGVSRRGAYQLPCVPGTQVTLRGFEPRSTP